MLGNQLKVLRQKNNLTQEMVARKLFVTRQTVSRWETGSVMPSVSALIDLANFYEVPFDELLGERKVISMKKVNPVAVFGSIVFNLLFLSIVGLSLIVFWLVICFLVLTFLFAPVLFLLFVGLGDQSFDLIQFGFIIFFFLLGLTLIKPVKILSIFLFYLAKNYLRYQWSQLFYRVEESSKS